VKQASITEMITAMVLRSAVRITAHRSDRGSLRWHVA
jgi:hypothetical protein